MFRYFNAMRFTTAALFAFCAAGCSQSSSNGPSSSAPIQISGPPPATVGFHDHAHSAEGPHHGALIELGNEDYHAELVHDEASGGVVIYLLDSTAKLAVPIDSVEATINLKHDGHGEQFKLSASPQLDDPEGKASRFISSDKELAEDLDRAGAEAQLVISINGKQYRGQIDHDHDHDHGHEGHNHADH